MGPWIGFLITKDDSGDSGKVSRDALAVCLAVSKIRIRTSSIEPV